MYAIVVCATLSFASMFDSSRNNHLATYTFTGSGVRVVLSGSTLRMEIPLEDGTTNDIVEYIANLDQGDVYGYVKTNKFVERWLEGVSQHGMKFNVDSIVNPESRNEVMQHVKPIGKLVYQPFDDSNLNCTKFKCKSETSALRTIDFELKAVAQTALVSENGSNQPYLVLTGYVPTSPQYIPSRKEHGHFTASSSSHHSHFVNHPAATNVDQDTNIFPNVKGHMAVIKIGLLAILAEIVIGVFEAASEVGADVGAAAADASAASGEFGAVDLVSSSSEFVTDLSEASAEAMTDLIGEGFEDAVETASENLGEAVGEEADTAVESAADDLAAAPKNSAAELLKVLAKPQYLKNVFLRKLSANLKTLVRNCFVQTTAQTVATEVVAGGITAAIKMACPACRGSDITGFWVSELKSIANGATNEVLMKNLEECVAPTSAATAAKALGAVVGLATAVCDDIETMACCVGQQMDTSEYCGPLAALLSIHSPDPDSSWCSLFPQFGRGKYVATIYDVPSGCTGYACRSYFVGELSSDASCSGGVVTYPQGQTWAFQNSNDMSDIIFLTDQAKALELYQQPANGQDGYGYQPSDFVDTQGNTFMMQTDAMEAYWQCINCHDECSGDTTNHWSYGVAGDCLSFCGDSVLDNNMAGNCYTNCANDFTALTTPNCAK